MMKIAVMGYSGSGKSTLAKHLSDRYGIPLLHLDQVNFEAGWQEREISQALHIVREVMERPGWVIDGNYARFYQQERLEQADRIVLLLFNRFCALWRILRRSREFHGRTRDSMAPGCVEKLDTAFLWWILVQGRTPSRRRQYRQIMRAYPDKTVILKNQRQLDRFIRGMEGAGSGAG